MAGVIIRPLPDTDPTYLYWSGNWAAVVGVLICVFLLLLWVDRNAIYVKGRRGN